MKTIKYLGFILAAVIIFMACQKEMSLETGYSGGNAIGSINNTSGRCDSTTQIHGQYVRDSLLKDSNYVLLQVNFTQPGLYSIVTETQNGFSFYDSGYMINTGIQSIKLKAVGKPVATQNTSFLVTFGTSFCSFTIPVLDTPNKKAIYLIDSAGGCGILSGTYKVGVALNPATEYITMHMDVSFPGIYTIQTNTVNGMTFKASGQFAAVGNNQAVVLRGSGTPLASRRDTFVVVAANSNITTRCSIIDTVLPAAIPTGPTAADSAWSFNQGTSFNYGPIDSAVISTISVGGISVPGVGVYGSSYATGDSLFFVGVPLTSGTIATGTYNSNSLTKPAAFGFYKDTVTNPIFTATYPDAAIGVNTTVTITSYDTTTKVLKGMFTGTARSGTSSVPITNGKFTATVR